MNNGLTERDIKTITAIFSRHPSIAEVYLFGSRAKDDYTSGSDIDLAVINEQVTSAVISSIKGELEESSLPYIVDIINYSVFDKKEMKEHIDRVGVLFYNRASVSD